MASATAAVAGSTNMIGGGGAAPTKAGSSGVESLPKEMNEMKLRDDKVDHSDDKVGTCSVDQFLLDVMPCASPLLAQARRCVGAVSCVSLSGVVCVEYRYLSSGPVGRRSSCG